MQSYSLFYGCFEVPSFLSSSLVTFLCGLVTFSVVVCFDLLLFIFGESTVGFCFVATKRLNIKYFIDRTVFYDYSHITDCIHKLPVYHPFNVVNNLPLFILRIHAHYCSYSYFLTLLSFTLYSRVKWLRHHQITVVEYSEFDYILTFPSVLCSLRFSCSS